MESKGHGHEADYREVVQTDVCGSFLPDTHVEVLREPPGRGRYLHVLFDFDGTLSLIRQGWPDVMIPMMVEVLLGTGTSESPDELSALVEDFVMRLNGKQTIYQMLRLVDEVEKRGGLPRDPLLYKRTYHARLMEAIGGRREDLRSGRTSPAEMLVPGAFDLLSALSDKGLQMYLASGTDECYVKEEAELLNLTAYFGRRIYGAVDDYNNYSKQMVIERILSENRIEGRRLCGFGDGYVEIENVKSVGGAAVGVASDEQGRSGKPDEWKRKRLIGTGADLIIPDYQDSKVLVDYLFSEAQT